MERLLNAYLALAWGIAIVAALLVQRQEKHVKVTAIPAIILFSLGWPVILPVVAVYFARRPEDDQPPAR